MNTVVHYPFQPALAVERISKHGGHHCSFCDARESEVYRLIAAQSECICNRCVSAGVAVLLERTAKIANPQPVLDLSSLYCRFCGKETGEFTEILARRDVTICSECLAVCVDTLLKAEATMQLALKF